LGRRDYRDAHATAEFRPPAQSRRREAGFASDRLLASEKRFPEIDGASCRMRAPRRAGARPFNGRARRPPVGRKNALKPLKSLCRGPECALAFRFARPEWPGRPLGPRRRTVDDYASRGTTALEGERPQSGSFARPPAPPLSAS
jgi:hypothetical protein